MARNDVWKARFAEVSAALENADPKPVISSQTLTANSLARTIDHTLLKLDATTDQVTELCKEAIQYDFAAVCLRLNFIAHAAQLLKDTPAIKAGCAIGFHEGTQPTAAKVAEAQDALAAGAGELDVVLNRETLQAGDYAGVYEELKALRSVVPASIVFKLIFETSQLTKDEIIATSVLAGYAGFDYIKTSTGFCGHGAKVEHVLLMNKVAAVLSQRNDLAEYNGKKMKVKASGGVRTLEDAKNMVDAGAERVGTSGGIKIMKDFLGEGGAEPAGSGY